MMKFTYQYDASSPLIEITLSPDATLGDALFYFEGFLKASGYAFNGEIDLIESIGPPPTEN